MKFTRKRKKKVLPTVPAEGMSLERMCRERWHHRPDGRFETPWQPLDPRTLTKVIRWKLDRDSRRSRPKGAPLPVTPVNLRKVFSGNLTVTFLGHSTLLIQMDGITLLTDPVFSNLSPYLKRKVPLPLSRKLLREITQVVLISHNHYDHFSLRALRLLRDKAYITPLGFERYFHARRVGVPITLDWFDQVSFKSLKITLLPVQHWSRRTLRDTNRTLWGGYLIEGPSGTIFFGGDTGYYAGFKELGTRFHIDVAILPIGAFAPRWLMKTVHLSPYEAVKTALDLRAATLIPCHWGTYQISDEPLTFPLDLLNGIKSRIPLPLTIFPLLPGETYVKKI